MLLVHSSSEVSYDMKNSECVKRVIPEKKYYKTLLVGIQNTFKTRSSNLKLVSNNSVSLQQLKSQGT